MFHSESLNDAQLRKGDTKSKWMQPYWNVNCIQRTKSRTVSTSSPRTVALASLIPGLPNEISEICIARIVRAAYPKLSSVCKQWKQLCESNEICNLRMQLNCAEPWIYVLAERPVTAFFKAFDPKLNKWHDLPPVPNTYKGWCWQGFKCVAVGHRLLIMGGMYSRIDKTQAQMYMSSVVSGDVLIYDASINHWLQGASMNTPRSWFAAAVVGDLVYVAGGQGRDRFLNSVEVYDAKKDQWSCVPNMIHVRSSCCGFTLHDKLWVVGGENVRDHYERRGSAEVYDPATGLWTLIPEMLIDSQKVPAPNTVYNGKLHLVHENKLMLYEEDCNVWSHVGELPGGVYNCPRFGFAFESVNDDLYVIGGRRTGKSSRNSTHFLSTTEVCNLVSQASSKVTRWQNAAAMGDSEGIILASAVVTL